VGGRTIAYQYTLSYVRSLPSTSETGKIAAIDAIATALRLPTIFDFDPLFKLDAVIAVKDHELFSLLHIFLNEGLSQFKTWEGKHASAFQQYSESHFHIELKFLLKKFTDLDKTQLERKIRLLTLASLGFKNIGQDLPYATIASALQVDPSEVEKWAIDGRYILSYIRL
jgi:translation initiation factor 3 subunit M